MALQESYDNAGLLTGSRDMEAHAALVCIDITEEVIDDAISPNPYPIFSLSFIIVLTFRLFVYFIIFMFLSINFFSVSTEAVVVSLSSGVFIQ